MSASSHSARSSIPMPGGMKCAVPGRTASRARPMPCTSPMRPPSSSRNIATACSTTDASASPVTIRVGAAMPLMSASGQANGVSSSCLSLVTSSGKRSGCGATAL